MQDEERLALLIKLEDLLVQELKKRFDLELREDYFLMNQDWEVHR